MSPLIEFIERREVDNRLKSLIPPSNISTPLYTVCQGAPDANRDLEGIRGR